MRILMYDLSAFKSFINLVYDTSKEIKLIFDNEGLKINLLNDSHVCFYMALFKREFFEVYELDDPITELVFDTKDLFLVLKSNNGNKDNSLIIESYDGVNYEFIFESDGDRRVFEIGLIDESYESPVPPNIEHEVDFIMDWSDLKQCCDDLDNVIDTDRFVFVLDDRGCRVCSPNDAIRKYSNTISNESFKDIRTIVNVSYMNILSKLAKQGDLELHLGNNLPLGWSINSFDVEYKGMIAPIIEDE